VAIRVSQILGAKVKEGSNIEPVGVQTVSMPRLV
jgi:hypothetical protein